MAGSYFYGYRLLKDWSYIHAGNSRISHTPRTFLVGVMYRLEKFSVLQYACIDDWPERPG